MVLKVSRKPPFQVPVEINVALSYHNTAGDFSLLLPVIRASDVVCPESCGVYKDVVGDWLSAFRGRPDERDAKVAEQLVPEKPDAEFCAASVYHLFNHPHIFPLDVMPTRGLVNEVNSMYLGSTIPAINAFTSGDFEGALNHGFDTVESRARASYIRHHQILENAVTELPSVVNQLRPIRGDRVICAILMGSEHVELPGLLKEGLRTAGDVVVNHHSLQNLFSAGFDRLAHKVIQQNLQPLDRADAGNREQVARGVLDLLILNFYPTGSPIRDDKAYGASLITPLSDGLSLSQIECICGEAGGKVRLLSNKRVPYVFFPWIKTLREHGVVLPPTYPQGRGRV